MLSTSFNIINDTILKTAFISLVIDMDIYTITVTHSGGVDYDSNNKPFVGRTVNGASTEYVSIAAPWQVGENNTSWAIWTVIIGG